MKSREGTVVDADELMRRYDQDCRQNISENWRKLEDYS